MPAASGDSAPFEEQLCFQTETGSVYELTRYANGQMAWVRRSSTLASGRLRAQGGRLLEWPEVFVGARCTLLSEPINPPFTRVVRTSFVVAILDDNGRVIPSSAAGARRTFRYLQVGDVARRVVAGQPMGDYTVTAVEAALIHCGPWTFDRITGIEVDPELGLGPGGLIGTWLVHSDSEEDD